MSLRAKLDVDDLLRVLLVLVIIWLALELISEVLSMVLGPFFALAKPLIGLVVLALIVLWLVDRI